MFLLATPWIISVRTAAATDAAAERGFGEDEFITDPSAMTIGGGDDRGSGGTFNMIEPHFEGPTVIEIHYHQQQQSYEPSSELLSGQGHNYHTVSPSPSQPGSWFFDALELINVPPSSFLYDFMSRPGDKRNRDEDDQLFDDNVFELDVIANDSDEHDRDIGQIFASLLEPFVGPAIAQEPQYEEFEHNDYDGRSGGDGGRYGDFVDNFEEEDPSIPPTPYDRTKPSSSSSTTSTSTPMMTTGSSMDSGDVEDERNTSVWKPYYDDYLWFPASIADAIEDESYYGLDDDDVYEYDYDHIEDDTAEDNTRGRRLTWTKVYAPRYSTPIYPHPANPVVYGGSRYPVHYPAGGGVYAGYGYGPSLGRYYW